MTNMNTKMR